ncbi:hypothetical protein M758_2G017700 [Ceratodon purpureus]|uniref:Uncharacterized protein n=1 Tax=Ceratodon purpureus TaxID=3225 RepID=A0A8T0IR46_CERPU|nr:hypothetical protein KC19_2G018600 [Ceratodon purpureus]KAG0624972.1 hypothetical protein M758_2G017700 [Ceratodon purpureus]
MGNYICVSGKNQQVQDEWQGPPAKVIRPDGAIEVFRRTVTVGELMKQHPDHSVCHSSAMISTLTTSSALSADRELEGGRLYYVLPAHKFIEKAKLSPAEGKPVPRGRGKLTVEIKSTPGFAQVTVKGQAGPKIFCEKHGGPVKDMDDSSEEPIISYSTPDLRTMYLSSRSQPGLARSNSWKPRLETINEVGAASRRHIQNFMRARSLRKSQVHNY